MIAKTKIKKHVSKKTEIHVAKNTLTEDVDSVFKVLNGHSIRSIRTILQCASQSLDGYVEKSIYNHSTK